MCQSCDDPSHQPSFERRNFLKLAGAATLGFIFANRAEAASAAVPKPNNVLTPNEALARLLSGNKRYVNGVMKRHNFEAERPDLVLGQNPFAGILSCADSRIAPEYAFDTGRGDLFVCRVAGNFANKDSIASFEYGVAVLGVPLIMVLGHQSCGAVDSTIKAVKDGATFPGHIPSLINALRPAVVAAEHEQGDLLVNATRINVARSVQTLKTATPILDAACKNGKLKVVGAVYNLASGKVDLVA